MKKKSLNDIRNKEIDKLSSEVSEIKLKIAKSLSEMKAGKEKNLKKVRNLRYDLAQILTVTREKELTNKNKRKEEEK